MMELLKDECVTALGNYNLCRFIKISSFLQMDSRIYYTFSTKQIAFIYKHAKLKVFLQQLYK